MSDNRRSHHQISVYHNNYIHIIIAVIYKYINFGYLKRLSVHKTQNDKYSKYLYTISTKRAGVLLSEKTKHKIQNHDKELYNIILCYAPCYG